VSLVAVIGVRIGGVIRRTAVATTALALLIVGGFSLGQVLSANVARWWGHTLGGLVGLTAEWNKAWDQLPTEQSADANAPLAVLVAIRVPSSVMVQVSDPPLAPTVALTSKAVKSPEAVMVLLQGRLTLVS